MLGTVIEHAPEPPTAVAILDRANQIIPTVHDQVRPRGSVRVLLTATAVAALIAGLIAITVSHRNETTPSVAPLFSPPGTELQLVVTPGTASDAIGAVKPDSSVQVIVAGRFNLSWYTTVAMYEGHAIEMDCDVHGGCSPYVATPGPHTARVTDDSEGKDFWAWVGVPSDATYVMYSDGETVRWQHPVRGIAAFPVTTNDKAASVTALDEAGNTLATADLQNTPLDLPPFDSSRYRDLTAEQKDQMHLVINDAITACLQTPDGTWTSCVEAADQTLVQWFDDRANERRANDGTTP